MDEEESHEDSGSEEERKAKKRKKDKKRHKKEKKKIRKERSNSNISDGLRGEDSDALAIRKRLGFGMGVKIISLYLKMSY